MDSWRHSYAIGLPEQDFLFASSFCKDDSCIAILPDYRRSTEVPYPAALEDCYLTLEWMDRNAEKLGINRNQIFVGGDSAGGGLTAALCLYARDKGKIPIAFQMPLYPMLDDREMTQSSKDNDAPIWNTKSNRAGWKLYLKSINDNEVVPYYAATSRAEDYKGMPPCCTYVGTIEPFHAFDLIAYPTKPAKEARKFLIQTFRYAQKNYFTNKNR